MKGSLVTAAKVRVVVALAVLAVLAPPLTAAGASTSPNIHCSLVSYSFAGSSGGSEYWKFVTKITNNRPTTHRIHVELHSPWTQFPQYTTHFSSRVSGYSWRKVSNTITVAAGNGWPDLVISACLVADP